MSKVQTSNPDVQKIAELSECASDDTKAAFKLLDLSLSTITTQKRDSIQGSWEVWRAEDVNQIVDAFLETPAEDCSDLVFTFEDTRSVADLDKLCETWLVSGGPERLEDDLRDSNSEQAETEYWESQMDHARGEAA